MAQYSVVYTTGLVQNIEAETATYDPDTGFFEFQEASGLNVAWVCANDIHAVALTSAISSP